VSTKYKNVFLPDLFDIPTKQFPRPGKARGISQSKEWNARRVIPKDNAKEIRERDISSIEKRI